MNQKLFKISLWVSGLCVLFIVNAVMTDMFNVRTKSLNYIDSSLATAHSDKQLKVTDTNSSKGKRALPAADTTGAKVLDAATRFSKRKMITHIAFLKVHKAGSTTIQNMLFRFGIKHNLNIILSKFNNQLGPKKRHKMQMPIKEGEHNDIFALHTTYSKEFFDSLLPADHVKIGIVREPLSRMISAAYYHRDVYHVQYLTQVPRADFIHNLVNYPEKYDKVIFSQTRNTMARDFGFSPEWKQTDTKTVQNYLNKLNSEFLFVMIMEKIDESLVYLRRLLNWSIADILYIKTNSHKHAPVVLNKTEESKLRKTCSFDFDIYEYFAKIFDDKLKDVPRDFWQEVSYLKKLISKVSHFCEEPENSKITKESMVIAPSEWDNSITVTRTDCTWMKTQELSFIEKLRKRHHRRHDLT